MNRVYVQASQAGALLHRSAWPSMIRRARKWPPIYYVTFAITVSGLQLLAGTSVAYVLLFLAFLIVTYLTLSYLGGTMTLPGFCVTYLALQHVIIYSLAKVYYGLPADRDLIHPVETMLMYIVGMISMMCAALTIRNYWPHRWQPYFKADTDPRRLFWLAIITTLAALGRSILVSKGTTALAVNSSVFISPLSIAASTAYYIVASRGRRSFGLLNAVAILSFAGAGVVEAGRTNIVISVMIYFLTCYAFQFRFRMIHLLVIISGIIIANFILFPYAMYARNVIRTGGSGNHAKEAIDILGDVILDPMKYQRYHDKEEHVSAGAKRFRFFHIRTSILDRFSVILSTDSIVNATLVNGTTDMQTIMPALEALLPRYLNPYHQNVNTSNFLARRVPGLVGKRDMVTPITLGSFCDAFSSFGWWGIAIIPYILLLGYCLIWKVLFDVRLWNNVIALAMTFIAAGTFSEGTIAPQISNVVDGFFVLIGLLFILRALVNVTQNFRVFKRRKVLPAIGTMKQSL